MVKIVRVAFTLPLFVLIAASSLLSTGQAYATPTLNQESLLTSQNGQRPLEDRYTRYTYQGNTCQEDTSRLGNFNARQYDCKTGHFASPDPLSNPLKNPQDASLYPSSNSNPFKYQDPSGAEERPTYEDRIASLSGKQSYTMGDAASAWNLGWDLSKSLPRADLTQGQKELVVGLVCDLCDVSLSLYHFKQSPSFVNGLVLAGSALPLVSGGMVKALLKGGARKEVLEIGFGGGGNLLVVDRAGDRIVGVDIYDSGLIEDIGLKSYIQARGGDVLPGVDVAELLPQRAASFDRVDWLYPAPGDWTFDSAAKLIKRDGSIQVVTERKDMFLAIKRAAENMGMEFRPVDQVYIGPMTDLLPGMGGFGLSEFLIDGVRHASSSPDPLIPDFAAVIKFK